MSRDSVTTKIVQLIISGVDKGISIRAEAIIFSFSAASRSTLRLTSTLSKEHRSLYPSGDMTEGGVKITSHLRLARIYNYLQLCTYYRVSLHGVKQN